MSKWPASLYDSPVPPPPPPPPVHNHARSFCAHPSPSARPASLYDSPVAPRTHFLSDNLHCPRSAKPASLCDSPVLCRTQLYTFLPWWSSRPSRSRRSWSSVSSLPCLRRAQRSETRGIATIYPVNFGFRTVSIYLQALDWVCRNE